jgi:plasmid stabilization system protein ParE
MYKVIWLKSAQEDAWSIVMYTKTEWGQIQAEKLIDILEQSTVFMTESPKLGRLVRSKNTYVLVLPKVPFVIVYYMIEEKVYVTQVIHTSRRL